MSQETHNLTIRTPDERLRHFLNQMEEAAAYGLLEEVRTTPKPGLVDLHDSGAHRDMCYQTFVDSTHAIVPYLAEMAEAGWRHDGDLKGVFPAIRPVGVKAEQAMFAATGGVNTHKGMIFSLGIIAPAWATCCGNARKMSPSSLTPTRSSSWPARRSTTGWSRTSTG